MYKKLECCKFCSFSFLDLNTSARANHTRWCMSNPKSDEYRKQNNASHLREKEVILKRSRGIKDAWANGSYNDVDFKSKKFNHTKESIEKIRSAALISTHRRLVRSVRCYTKLDGTTVNLDSSWEELLARRLDNLNIEWIRPAPIKWVDRLGKMRNYFPDFYLPSYNLYLDPKNDYAYMVQIDKINCLLEQVSNLKFIRTEEECKTFNI